MSDFAVGTWNLVDTKNFDEYLKAIGKFGLVNTFYFAVLKTYIMLRTTVHSLTIESLKHYLSKRTFAPIFNLKKFNVRYTHFLQLGCLLLIFKP